MSNNIIQINAVSKGFHQHTVLETISFDVYDGEFLSLLGPSGCGKTTLLRLLAGFEKPDTGTILMKGVDVTGFSPQERQVNTVFQSLALFPHLTVFENVAFGLRVSRQKDITKKVDDALHVVQLGKFGHRKPHQLSGGQQQRVAIARAIVNKPLVLLLDEPLSALDYQLRKNMQFELKNLQRELGITFILVTHDQEEALSMADRVAVMHHGRIEQLGTPREVYEEPKNLHVATFIGQANIFDTEVVEANDSQLVLSIEGTLFPLKNKRGYKKGDRVHMVLRPEDLSVWSEHEVDYTGSMLPAVVKQFIYKGSTVDLVLQLPSGTLLMASEFFDEDDENLEYSVGESVWVEWVPGWEVVLPYDKK